MRVFSIARGAFDLALIVLVAVLLLRHPPAPKADGGPIAEVATQDKVVALTYDDGPHPDFTPAILSALDMYQVKATFFMIGERMEKYPEIVKEAVAKGHVIGNHTYSHPRDLESLAPSTVIRELDDCEEVIERITGKRTHLFRPPRGLLSGTILTVAKEEGYQTILWTVSADHQDAPTPELMAKRVLDHVKPGAIILAHDGTFASRINDVKATPLIIEELKRRGYRFVTVPELLKMGNNGRGTK
jgi:peptidoglycan/xylan/chitin deacetylase (PgdA/CDA1 family)